MSSISSRQECRDRIEVNVVNLSVEVIVVAESVLDEHALMSSQLDPGALPPHRPVHHGQVGFPGAELRHTRRADDVNACQMEWLWSPSQCAVEFLKSIQRTCRLILNVPKPERVPASEKAPASKWGLNSGLVAVE